MFRFTLFALLLISSLIPSFHHLRADDKQSVEQKPKWQPPPAIKSIDKVVKDYVDRGRASGAVTLVARNGKVLHLGPVGMRDLDAKKPMQRWTRFAIASMTKPITATAVMILQDEGKLNVCLLYTSEAADE